MTAIAICECCKQPASSSSPIFWHATLHAALCRGCHQQPSAFFVAVRRDQINRGQIRRIVLRQLSGSVA